MKENVNVKNTHDFNVKNVPIWFEAEKDINDIYSNKLNNTIIPQNQDKSRDFNEEYFRTNNNEKQSEWQPLSFNNIELPTFPVDELHGVVGEYVKAVAINTQTPPDMAATAALAMLALSMQGKFMITAKNGWVEPLNLYALVVAASSDRKSAVLKPMMSDPIKRYEKEENQRLESLIEKNKMEKSILEKKKKKLEDKIVNTKGSENNDTDIFEMDELAKKIGEFKEIKPCRLFCDDVTPEMLASVLYNNNGRTAIISSEGGIFDIMAGRYSKNINIETFLKAYSCEPIRVDREGRSSEYILNPAMTIMIFAQPKVLENLMSNDLFVGKGLCSRFIYSIPTSLKGYRIYDTAPIPETIEEKYYNLLEKFLKMENPTPTMLTLSKNASTLFRKLYYEIEPMMLKELADIEDFAGKFCGTVLRIAGILHLAESSELTEVNGNTMSRAVKIGLYYLRHAEAAYRVTNSNKVMKDAEYVWEKIKNNTEISFRDIQRAQSRFPTKALLEPIVKVLVDMEYLRETDIMGKSGKLIKGYLVYQE